MSYECMQQTNKIIYDLEQKYKIQKSELSLIKQKVEQQNSEINKLKEVIDNYKSAFNYIDGYIDDIKIYFRDCKKFPEDMDIETIEIIEEDVNIKLCNILDEIKIAKR